MVNADQVRRASRCGGRPTTIRSLATYVPPRLLTNADLEKMVETSDEWILQRTGIRERHIVDAGVATSDLGTEAAVKAYQAQHALAQDGVVGPRTWWVPAGAAGATLASLAGLTTA